MKTPPDPRKIRRARILMFAAGCISLGCAFGWQVGLGLFLVAPYILTPKKRL